MIITLKKYGKGSRALVIPKAILKLLDIDDKTEFDINTENDELVIRAKRIRAKKIASAKKSILKKHSEVYKSLAEKWSSF